MMNFINNPLSVHVYYFIIPYDYQCYPDLNTSHSLSSDSVDNAETTATTTVSQEEKILVTKDDLLMEGYQKTKKAWTEEEDKTLLRLCANQNAKFDEIAELMPQRNAKMCYSRFRRLNNKSKDCWSVSENDKLRSLVDQYGLESWKIISPHFPNRNYKQLKDHYENYLRPNLSIEEWTVEEDLQLISLVNEFGKDWQILQKSIPHRSRNQIKNRFFGRIMRINSKKAANKC